MNSDIRRFPSLGRCFLLFSLFFLLMLTGCEKEENPMVIQYSTPNRITSLDQQFVTEEETQSIIRGFFTPLLRVDEEGQLKSAGATDYQVSPDGLTIRFTLRQDLFWSDGKPLTAWDYAFGLTRLFTPVVSDLSKEYLTIKNAEQVLRGQLPKEELGIHVLDDYQLEIQLEHPSQGFLTAFLTVGAFPCREDFFLEQRGRYATNKDTFLSCGPFLLKEWTTDHLWMVPNEDHPLYQVDGEVKIFQKGKGAEDFLAGKSSIYLLSEEDLSQFSEYPSFSLDRQSYCVFINPNHKGLQNEAIRREFMAAASENFSNIPLGDGEKTRGIFPPEVLVEGMNYREKVGDSLPSLGGYPTAHQFTQHLQEQGIERMPSITISYPKTIPGELFANEIHLALRDKLAVNTNLASFTEDQLIAKLQSGDYDLVIAPLTTAGNDFMSYLSQLARILPEENLFSRLSDQRLPDWYMSAVAIEQDLMNSGLVIPLYHMSAFGVYQSPITSLSRQPYTGIILPGDFVHYQGESDGEGD